MTVWRLVVLFVFSGLRVNWVCGGGWEVGNLQLGRL